MSNIKFSVSGLRGIVGEGLVPEVLLKAILAYNKIISQGTIVIGRDSRVSGEMINRYVSSVLNWLGRDIIDLGVVTTPTVEVNVPYYKAAGGIIITASHNPLEWNALKFLDSNGEFLNEDKIIEMKNIFNEITLEEYNKCYKDVFSLGKLMEKKNANSIHISKILDVEFINPESIKAKKFKIAVDTVNGAGIGIIRELAKALDIQLYEVNCEPTGIFKRGAEPIPENLKDLSQTVIKNKCDIGFALDPDGDRLAIVDENGRPIGEEYTLAIVADFVLQYKKGDIAANLSSSMVLDDVAKKYGVRCLRSKVGEINVSMLMKKMGCVIGGEGNGGVISPDVHYGRDAIVGIIYVLQYLTNSGETISNIRNKFKTYYILKEKFNVEGFDKKSLLKKFEGLVNIFEIEDINKDDGIKLIGKDFWVHLRESNTEPIFRIMIESTSKDRNIEIYEKVKNILGV